MNCNKCNIVLTTENKIHWRNRCMPCHKAIHKVLHDEWYNINRDDQISRKTEYNKLKYDCISCGTSCRLADKNAHLKTAKHLRNSYVKTIIPFGNDQLVN